jgi:hypothetical protein
MLTITWHTVAEMPTHEISNFEFMACERFKKRKKSMVDFQNASICTVIRKLFISLLEMDRTAEVMITVTCDFFRLKQSYCHFISKKKSPKKNNISCSRLDHPFLSPNFVHTYFISNKDFISHFSEIIVL